MRVTTKLLVQIASFAIILALWQYFSAKAVISMLFPTPLSSLRTAIQLIQNGELARDTLFSLARILVGFAGGSAIGIVLGVLMGSFRTARLFFEPYVQFFRFLPALAWIPGAMLWLGTGELSKITLLMYTTVFVVALNVMLGVASVGKNQLRAAESFGATSWQMFFMVKVPSTVGYMLTEMRLAMGNCFATIVAAELLAANAGLGYLIFSARTWMQTELAFVGIIMLGILGLLVDQLFVHATNRFFARYLPSS